MVNEEHYDRLRGPAKNMTVLATVYAECGSERHEPAFMTISYGKGRVFHTVMGHSHTSMGRVDFQETLIRVRNGLQLERLPYLPLTTRYYP